MPETTVLGEPATRSESLIARSTIEVTARETDAAAVLKDHLPSGSRVHVTYLSNGNLAETVAQAAALAAAGFEPIPHLAARSMLSLGELNDYVARIVGEAGASRVLLIGGDLPRPRGPFAASLDVLRTGTLEGGGIKGVGFASHPEGHPAAPAGVIEAALSDKLAYASANGLEADIVTQFCFEAPPVIDHIARLRRIGVTAPVRIGVAAPTNAALMARFAVRCGVGPSLRALGQSARFGRLVDVAGPEALIADLALGLSGQAPGSIAGLHFFVFGGIRKAAAWLQTQRGLVAETGGVGG
jgi:methylenetetrahydrofolate reductase (NADH)